ncbi:MAG: aspartate kinase, partial [bacterium]
MRIYKFGGASVKDAQAVKNVFEILQNEDQKNLLVVISAMGKTTNALEEVWKAYLNNDIELSIKVEIVKTYHQNMISELFGSIKNDITDEVNNLFVELEWILEEEPDENKDFIYDQIVSLGELLSTRIVEAFLRASGLKTKWVDARSYLKSDNQYREAGI